MFNQRVLSFDVGLKNIGVCEVVLDDADMGKGFGINRMYLEDLCRHPSKKSTTKSTRTMNFEETSHELLEFLKRDFNTNSASSRESKLPIRTVLIENQPALRNPKMKSLQIIIYTFFKLHHDNPRVILVNANIKINRIITNTTNKTVVNEKTKKLTYTQRKMLSVEKTKEILKERDMSHWVNYIEGFKKKDDMADAFLQFFTTYYCV